MGSIGLVGPAAQWIAWFLLFLASLSLPIINSIYLFKAYFTLADGSKGAITFGIWAACVSGVKPEQMGFSGVTYIANGGQCTGRGLGLTTRVVDTTQVADIMFAGASWSLVLHPVACAAVIAGLFMLIVVWLVSLIGIPNSWHRWGERKLHHNLRAFLGLYVSLFPLGLIIVGSILTTVVFILDMIIVGSAITRAHDNHQAKTRVVFGAIPWMTFVAMLLTWVGVIEGYRSSFSFGPGMKMTHRPIDY